MIHQQIEFVTKDGEEPSLLFMYEKERLWLLRIHHIKHCYHQHLDKIIRIIYFYNIV